MRFLFDIAIAIILATVIGFLTSWYAINHGPLFGAVKVGEWSAFPEAGSSAADPYAVAMLARTGEIPLGAGEGIAFTAVADSSGARLSAACSYHISGQTPAARLWTLTVYNADGHLMANAAHRSGFHSREILRHPDGSFDIVAAREARPGNWLPIAGADPFILVLRLYDTPVTTGSQIADLTMPRIEREKCI